MKKISRSRAAASNVFLVIAAIFSFLIVSTAIRVVAYKSNAFENADTLMPKVAFAAAQAKIDALFVGPSYTEAGIDPSVFDQDIGSLGYPLRSFNLGVGGLGIVEIRHIINTMVDKKNCCKYVFITPSFYLFNIAANDNNIRGIMFMNLSHALAEFGLMSSTPFIPREALSRSDYLINIVKLAFRHYTNLGISSIFHLSRAQLSGNRDGGNINPTWDWNDRGYAPLVTRLAQSDYEVAIADIRNKRPGFVSRAATSNQPKYDIRVTPQMLNQIIEFGRQLEARGVIPLALMAPETSYWDWDADFATKFRLRCGDSHLFDYNDPIAFPELFAPEVRADGGHLNNLGAPIWTTLIARRMAQELRDGELTTPFCPP